jgi:hypothetical protein
VADDRAFRSIEDQEIISAIAADLGAQRETEAKKSVESIAVLTIGLLLKGVVTGVGAKIGGEVWVKIRPKLASLFAKKRASPAQLLKFAIAVQVLDEERLIEVIVSDPQPQDLGAIRTEVLDQAIKSAVMEIERGPHLVRIVFEYSSATGLLLTYAVATSGQAVPYARALPEGLPHSAVSLGGVPDDAKQSLL